MSSRPFLRLFLILVPLSIIRPALHAQCTTNVPGGVVVNQTWDLAGSPYCVTGDILVSLLTIEPGVQVLIDGPYQIEVLTVITAVGSPNQKILFAAKDPTVKWKGLRFEDASCDSQLIHCEIRDSDDSGIELINTRPHIESCDIHHNSSATDSGGGIKAFLTTGDLDLYDCNISQNTARSNGGGIDASLTIGTLRLNGCHIFGNVANPSDFGGSYFGGGIRVQGSSYIFESEVLGNTSRGNAGYFYSAGGWGGGISTSSGTCTIERSIITGNDVTAICSDFGCGPYGAGAGIAIDSGSLVMRNSIVGCNTIASGTPYGGGIYAETATLVSLENCTVARNDDFEILGDSVTSIAIRNSILTDANALQQYSTTGPLTIDYSDIKNMILPGPGIGNKNTNPAFAGSGCDMPTFESGSLTIVPGSPCIDAGDPNSAYNDVSFPPSLGGVRNDMGPHGGFLGGPQTCRARVLSRNGTGVNSVLLTNITKPRLNTNWLVDMDCTGHSPSPHATAYLFAMTRPTTGPTFRPGEILVDVTCGPGILFPPRSHSGNIVRITTPIPNDPSLCGLKLYCQGLISGPPGFELTNALDITLGQ